MCYIIKYDNIKIIYHIHSPQINVSRWTEGFCVGGYLYGRHNFYIFLIFELNKQNFDFIFKFYIFMVI